MTDRFVEHTTFVIERAFDAPPARVFAAWADAAAKQRWFAASDGWEVGPYELDFRVGGREHGSFRPPSGPVIRNETVYLDIIEPQRIVFAYSMAREDGPFTASLATVELRPDGTGTKLTFTEQGAYFDGRDQPRYREQGWNALLDALTRELARGAAAA